MDFDTPAWAVITTLSPNSMCPTNPDWPAGSQYFPTFVLPETPVCAEILYSHLLKHCVQSEQGYQFYIHVLL